MNYPEIAEMYPGRALGNYPETEEVIDSAKKKTKRSTPEDIRQAVLRGLPL